MPVACEDPNYGDYAEKATSSGPGLRDPPKAAMTPCLTFLHRSDGCRRTAVDRGAQYRSAIFYNSEEQKQEALRSREALRRSGRFTKPIVTEIFPASAFYAAEDYHQDYYKKRPVRYKFYRFNSGRDQFLNKVWATSSGAATSGVMALSKKPSQDELRRTLTSLQYRVTQEGLPTALP
jgi:hypothetical protein